jgi:hypothetical protein
VEILGRRLIVSPPAQVSSELAGRVASLYGSEENKALWFELAQVLGSDGLRMIEREAEHNPAAVRLAKALGKVSSGAVDTLLKQLIWSIDNSRWEGLPDKQTEVAAELVGLGSSIVPMLRRRIGHKWGTRHDQKIDAVVAQALAKLAPDELAAEVESRVQLPGAVSESTRAIFDGLCAHAPPSAAADRALMFAMSNRDGRLATLATSTLRKRLNGDRFADALFSFIARKSRFSVSEIDVYSDALISYRGISAAVVRNMAQRLKKAGRPEAMFWAHKYVGLHCLQARGNREALPLLEALIKDTSRYENVTNTIDSHTGQVTNTESQARSFAKLAEGARSAIVSREP